MSGAHQSQLFLFDFQDYCSLCFLKLNNVLVLESIHWHDVKIKKQVQGYGLISTLTSAVNHKLKIKLLKV